MMNLQGRMGARRGSSPGGGVMGKQLQVLIASATDLASIGSFDSGPPPKSPGANPPPRSPGTSTTTRVTISVAPGQPGAAGGGGGGGGNRKVSMMRKKSMADGLTGLCNAYKLEVPVESIASTSTQFAPDKALRYAERKQVRVLFTEDVAALLQAGPGSIPATEAPPPLQEAFAVPDHTQVLRVSVVDEVGLFLLTLRSPKLFAKAFYGWACEFLNAAADSGASDGLQPGETSFDEILHWLLVRETERQLGQAEADRILGGGTSDGGPASGPGEAWAEDGGGSAMARAMPGAGAKAGKESAHAVETRMMRTASAAVTAARNLHAEPMSQWRFRGSAQNCMVHSRSDGAFNPPIYRGQVTIRAPAHLTANYILEPSRRGVWDHLAARLAVVHEIDRCTRVERLSELTILDGHAPNDYFVVTGSKVFAPERKGVEPLTYVIASRSVSRHPDADPVAGYTRAEAMIMAYIVTHVDKTTCQVTCYFQVVYKGVLPKVVEHALHEGRLSSLIDLRDVLRSELISRSYPRTGPFTKFVHRDAEAQQTRPVTMKAIIKLARVLSRWKAVGQDGAEASGEAAGHEEEAGGARPHAGAGGLPPIAGRRNSAHGPAPSSRAGSRAGARAPPRAPSPGAGLNHSASTPNLPGTRPGHRARPAEGRPPDPRLPPASALAGARSKSVSHL